MQSITQVIPLLSQPKKIFITTHYKPDGDAIGSSLGLYHALLQMGHDVQIISPSDMPDFLGWMPGVEHILNFESEPAVCLTALTQADFIFCLDFNHLSRVKSLENALRQANQTKILIDHHLQPEENIFDYGVSKPEKSSTCEMVYDFLKLWNDNKLFNLPTIECLYVGTLTDTGSFRFAGTTAAVHEMVAFFKHQGLQHEPIHQQLFDVWSENRMKFLGYILLNKMEIFHEKHFGIISITKEEMNRYEIKTGDAEGVVNYILSIQGMQAAVLLSEKTEDIRLSFRSKGKVDVSAIAREYFDGGGHFNAAGGIAKMNMETALEKVKNILAKTI